MAEKTKKRLSRRAQERLKRQLRAFDLTLLGLGIATIAAGAICAAGSPALDRSGASGFAFWYLVVQSYLPMSVFGSVAAVAGVTLPAAGAAGAKFLVALDLGCYFVLWLVLRVLGKRNNKSPLLHVSTRIALIVLCWGCFQLGCAVVVAGWKGGGFASYHRVLTAPGASQTAEAQAAPAPEAEKSR